MTAQTQNCVLIRNGIVVLEDQLVAATIAVKDGIIDALLTDEEAIRQYEHSCGDEAMNRIDAAGRYILPGLIDIHNDAIEKEVQPRPNTLFPLAMSFLEFERKMPLHGITTMYHSLSLGVGLSLRGDHLLTGMVECIDQYRRERSVIRNRIHLRYEVSYLAGYPIVEQYIKDRKIDYLSFMDHSPGQGQYRAPGSFERYVMKNQGVGIEEVQVIVEELLMRRNQIDWENLRALSRLAGQQGIRLASHDDDSVEQVERSRGFGVSVTEFPINMETAQYAARSGLFVCVGAPNLVRGGSHDHNLRALDVIKEGEATIICSDYHPSSLLKAIFMLAEQEVLDLPAAVRLGTLYPAQALGIADQYGSIAPGKAADLILVDQYQGHPWVTHTIVGGKTVYTADAR
ncbi:alpha-D-ribose 1-methylphosphonate 5-triphosphate diphosphatase [Paenibacillus glycanilyticus]|uniref:Alpha-D-ribose 1-methylphosphonate 5-triphosphate diphosphatase n=1 Tax=Paenibacillus glycanilyticus TaxID=126569 RepID=A0ABQ6NTI9_9BACL|nr:alpha-D-ribose 1-methylphosphonate 5-triphosphate diphosphatase [Paenibacillus glycanilyticus]GMK47839.1 alpha-D-ribose 1-methylphosphonate 5-triphosphate diphosphatase [Paenibacillus glycanilyticus]